MPSPTFSPVSFFPPVGAPGDRVQIFGSNFTGATMVNFGRPTVLYRSDMKVLTSGALVTDWGEVFSTTNDLTQATMALQPTYSGGEISFTAANGTFLSIPSNSNFNLGNIAFSMAIWFNPASYPAMFQSYAIVSKMGTAGFRSYEILYDFDGRIIISLSTNGTNGYFLYNGTGVNPFPINNWHLFVMTFDGPRNILNVWIDNVQQQMDETIGLGFTTIFDSTSPFEVGNDSNYDIPQPYDGLVNSVAIWKNRLLTANEVNTLWTTGMPLTGNSTTFTVVNDNQIIATVPAGQSNEAAVSVMNATGTASDTTPFFFVRDVLTGPAMLHYGDNYYS